MLKHTNEDVNEYEQQIPENAYLLMYYYTNIIYIVIKTAETFNNNTLLFLQACGPETRACGPVRIPLQ